MTRRLLTAASILALTAGCSSSSSGTAAGDSGTTTQNDSSTIDTGTPASDDGGTVDTGTVGAQDSGTVNTGDSSTGDAGVCTALTTVTGIPAYASVAARSDCTGAQITDFLTECSTSAPAGACNTWFTTAANATCGQCISPAADSGLPENSGALLIDSAGQAYLNTPGCVQIKDGNTTCAAPLEQLYLCENDACDSEACLDADTATETACIQASEQVACANQLTAAFGTQTTPAVCSLGNDSADGGSIEFCNPQTTSGFLGVIATICDADNK